ncbi:hypothetical protein [Rhodoplanes azumiensis]|uniref:Uncharacterized protein n=1 Tax=Rhodoplanes azumiensis TaxID=1897628 RepID=A0ABW5AN67_9BRAD
MRYWIGIVMFAAAAAFVVSGVLHKRRVLAARMAAEARGIASVPPEAFSIAAVGEGIRPLILVFLTVTAAMIVVMFVLPGGDESLSLLDLGGVLAALAAYGIWMSRRVTYRMSDIVRAEAATAAPAGGGIDRPAEAAVGAAGAGTTPDAGRAAREAG